MKKTCKRLSALLLALVMVLSLVPTSALAARVENDAVTIAAPDTTDKAALSATMPDAPAELAEAEEIGPTNLADNAVVYASGITSGYGPERAVTGTANNHYWSGSTMKGTSPSVVYENTSTWIVVDLWQSRSDGFLGTVNDITQIDVQFGNNKAYSTQYVVQVAGDNFKPVDYSTINGNKRSDSDEATANGSFSGQNAVDDTDCWTTIKSMSNAESGNTDIKNTITKEQFEKTVPDGTRYVRLYFTGINSQAAAAPSINLARIIVTGTRTAAGDNLASMDGVTATASGVEDDNASLTPDKAIDNNADTRWSSANEDSPQWILIDLNRKADVSAISLQWHRTNVFSYQVYVSADKAEWTSVHDYNHSEPQEYITQANEVFPFDEPYTGIRYICLYCDGHDTAETEIYRNISLKELKVYGTVTQDLLTSETLHGKVLTSDEEPKAVEDAEVTLTDASYKEVPNFKVTTGQDGSYTFSEDDLSNLPAGTYYVRAHKADSGSAINTENLITVNNDHKVEDVEFNVTLDPIDPNNTATYTYTMEDEDSLPTLDISTVTNHPTFSYNDEALDDGALVLSFSNIDRMDNIVKLQGTNMRNGTVEFDAKRDGEYADNRQGRFGLAIRHWNSGEWIYVGQQNSDRSWFTEWWGKGSRANSGLINSISFGKGDTRHFKVTITEQTISLWVDGIPVIHEAFIGGSANANIPDIAADIGFICGNEGYGVPSTITIDNLYVFRNDPPHTVTLEEVDNGTLAAHIITSAGDRDLTNSQASVTERIKITLTGDDTNALETVTVTPASEDIDDSIEVTFVPADPGKDGYFWFDMPNYDVNVTGKTLPKLKSVKINETGEANLRAGKNLTTTVKDNSDQDVTANVAYQWYHGADMGPSPSAWTKCYVDLSGRGIGPQTLLSQTDVGRKVRIVVTGKVPGDGDSFQQTYASTYSVYADTDVVIQPAYVAADRVDFSRGGLTMWKGLTDPDSENREVQGNTAELYAILDSDVDTAPLTVQWFSSDESLVTVTKNGTFGIGGAVGEESIGKYNKTTVTVATDATAGTADIYVVVRNDGEAGYDSFEDFQKAIKAAESAESTEPDEGDEPDESDEGAAQSAAPVIYAKLTVTVKIPVTSVTIDTTGTDVKTEGQTKKLIIYANADAADGLVGDMKNSGYVHATVRPATASDTRLTWTLEEITGVSQPTMTFTPGKVTGKADPEVPGGTDDPEAAQLSDDPDDPANPGTGGDTSDETENPVESSGEGLTISAKLGSKYNVGQVKVVATSESYGADGTTKSDSFILEVRRNLKATTTPSISIKNGGTRAEPRPGDTLEVDPHITMTQAGWANMKYKWIGTKASADGTERKESTILQESTGDTGKTYTVKDGDIGYTISVEMTADTEKSFYEGHTTVEYATPVALRPGPKAPELTTRAASTDQSETPDGAIIITNYEDYEDYEEETLIFEYYSDSDNDQTLTDAKVVKVPAEGEDPATMTYEIQELAPGTYHVRVKATDTREASEWTIVTIFTNGQDPHKITVVKAGNGKGTVNVTNQAVKETKVTITVTPDVSSKLADQDPVVVVELNAEGQVNGDAQAITVSPDQEKANVYTFEMPDADVQVTVTLNLKKVTISHKLTNLKCDLSEDPQTSHVEDYGEVTKITLTVTEEGYALPDEDEVTITKQVDGEDVPWTGSWSYNKNTGEITFPNGVTEDITITAAAKELSYEVKLSQTRWNRIRFNSSTNATVKHGEKFTGTLEVTEEYAKLYKLPAQFTSITMGGEAIPENGYTYNSQTGEVTIEKVTGEVLITLQADEISYTLTTVKIQDVSANDNALRVGDTVTSTVTTDAPAGTALNATYKWYTCDESGENPQVISNANNATLTVPASAEGSYILLEVTGSAPYTGTKRSDPIGPVKAKWVAPYSVELSGDGVTGAGGRYTLTLPYNSTATVTAIVKGANGENATNQTLTWRSDNTTFATRNQETGLITAAAVGKTVFTVSVGESEENLYATLEVVVSAIPVTVTFSGSDENHDVHVGDTLKVEITPADAISSYNILWSKYRDGAGIVPLEEYDDELEYLVQESDIGYFIMVSVSPKEGSNYTGSDGKSTERAVLPAPKPITYTVTAQDGDYYTADVVTNGPFDGKSPVVVTLTPVQNYELTSITVTIGEQIAQDTTHYTIDKDSGTGVWTVTVKAPFAGNVIVTATTAEKQGTVDPDPGDTVNKDALDAAITKAKGLNSADYTTESWTKVAEALTAAEAIQNNADATQAEVDAAAKALTDAMDDLVKVNPGPGETANKDALDAAITKAKGLNSADYTTESWAKVAEALTDAEAIQNNADATQAEVDAAAKALTDAMDNLVKKGTDEPDPDEPSRKPVRPATPSPSSSVNPEGSKEIVETKPDGTVTETVENPDGSKEIVETKPDGTVIDTVVAADGTTTEKVTDPEGDVTITVTDAEGEELAKVELPAATPDPEDEFIDLDPTPWAEDSINHMAALKLVKGIGSNKYAPTDSMTRGALATVLYRLSQGKADYNVTFQDVAQGEYYTEGVAWAARVNVVTGYTEDIFAPDDTITREQLAVMLARYAKLIGMDTTADAAALDQFVDGDATGDWAVNGTAWCVEQGILQGKGADNLDPTAKITRAEVAVMLDRFIALIK